VNGYLDDIELNEVLDYEKKLFTHFRKHHASILLTIKVTKELSSETDYFLSSCFKYFTHMYKKARLQFSVATETKSTKEVEE